jgi:hypothetical protein
LISVIANAFDPESLSRVLFDVIVLPIYVIYEFEEEKVVEQVKRRFKSAPAEHWLTSHPLKKKENIEAGVPASGAGKNR